MKMTQPKTLVALCLNPLLSLVLLGCGGSGEGETPETPEASVSPKIDAVLLSTSPADPTSVIEARKTAKPGDEIVVDGKIAGTVKPFTEGFASLVLADKALRTCELNPDENCPTPWDACCVEPEELKASRLTIQILDETGRPVAQSLKGLNGLAELDPIVVSGFVDETSSEENLILNVTGLYLTKEG
ncbi:MAG: hypothetical protein AAGC68_03940 [Verrucomicrobiota bacterium]